MDDNTAWLHAAAILAEAWKHALAREYGRGRAEGYAAGYAAADNAMAATWADVAAKVRGQAGRASVAELAQRRANDHRPCPDRCERCSRCIHAWYWAVR